MRASNTPPAELTGAYPAASARVTAAQTSIAPRTSASATHPVGTIEHMTKRLRRLPSNWKKIGLASLIGVMLGQIYIWAATPMYASTATLLVDPSARKISDVLAGGIEPDTALVESQVAIITSDAVLKKVIESLNLAHDPEFAAEKSPLGKAIRAALIPGTTQGTAFERALASLKKTVRVSRAQKSYALGVTATTRSPQKSAAIVTAVIDAYLADRANSKNGDANRANELIASQLSELHEQVRQAEARADEYKKANKVQTAEGGTIDEQRLTRLSAERDAARNAAAESKAQWDQLQAAINAGSENYALSDTGNTGRIARLRDQYAQLLLRETSLLARLKPAHPDIIDIRSQIASVKVQISADLHRLAVAASTAYDVASNREKELEKQLEVTKQILAQQKAAQSRESELDQEVFAKRQLLSSFLTRPNETQEQEKIAAPQARVISQAAPANAPSRPTPLFVLASSFIAGLTGGILWALRQTQSDHSVTAAADLANLTGVPSVSLIPQLKHPFASAHSVPRHGGHYNDLLSALESPPPLRAVAYQQAILRLLSKIKSHGRAGRPNTVMFASPRAKAGNSAATLAAAYSAAISGERVLLVDATSTNPELSEIFAANLATSTTVVLDSKEHLNRIVSRDGSSGLSVLPIALADFRTLRVQQRRRLVAGLNLLSQDYDWIFIDAGALLDDEAATMLLPATDIVVLVARAGETSSKDIDGMMQILDPARSRIAGSVLTFADT